MRTLMIFFMILGMLPKTSAQTHQYHFLDAEETALEPAKVYILVGKKNQKKPTWGMVEENGNPTEAAGNISQVKDGNEYSIFRVLDIQFVLPSNSFSMKNGTLQWKGKTVEALTLEFKPAEECEGLSIGKDSLTKHMNPQHKLALNVDLDQALWYTEGAYTVPSLPVDLVDSLSTATKEAYYILGIKGEDGRICKALALNRDQLLGKIVYIPSFREGGRFTEKDGEYYLDGEKVTGFAVLGPRKKTTYF
jgi:hypothetical protein